jgi:hypothetical protein
LQFLLQLLHIQLYGYCFEIAGKTYKQISGLPMGRAWAPAVACIFMYEWENLLFRKLSTPPVFYKRYLDDIVFIANSGARAEEILTAMVSVSKVIRTGSFSVGIRVNFLDLTLTLVPNASLLSVRLPFVYHLGYVELHIP